MFDDDDSSSITSNDSTQESVIQQASTSKYKPAESVQEIMERLSKIKTETQKYEDDTNSLIQSVIVMKMGNSLLYIVKIISSGHD